MDLNKQSVPGNWDQLAYYILEELKRLNAGVNDLRETMEAQQDEYHKHRIDALRDNSDTRQKFDAEITRLDKEISFVKGKIAVVSSSIGAFVASLPAIVDTVKGWIS